jgi:hypothetical protein
MSVQHFVSFYQIKIKISVSRQAANIASPPRIYMDKLARLTLRSKIPYPNPITSGHSNQLGTFGMLIPLDPHFGQGLTVLGRKQVCGRRFGISPRPAVQSVYQVGFALAGHVWVA